MEQLNEQIKFQTQQVDAESHWKVEFFDQQFDKTVGILFTKILYEQHPDTPFKGTKPYPI